MGIRSQNLNKEVEKCSIGSGNDDLVVPEQANLEIWHSWKVNWNANYIILTELCFIFHPEFIMTAVHAFKWALFSIHLLFMHIQLQSRTM